MDGKKLSLYFDENAQIEIQGLDKVEFYLGK